VALELELAAVESEIEESIAAFATAGVSPTLRAQALVQLETRKAEVEARLSAVEEPPAFTVPEELRNEMKITPQGLMLRGASLRELLSRPEVDGNAFLRKALERVEVAPGRAPIYDRAKVTSKTQRSLTEAVPSRPSAEGVAAP
jgi:hypothetical protein